MSRRTPAEVDMDVAECGDRDPTTETLLRLGPSDKRKLYVLLEGNVPARMRRVELLTVGVFVQLMILLLQADAPRTLMGLLT